MKSHIKKNILRMNAYYVGLSLCITSFTLLLNNYYNNLDNNIENKIQTELQKSVAKIEIEKKVHNYLNESVNKNLIENPDFFRKHFMPSLDSIIDKYSNNIKPEIKDYITQSINDNAERWIKERYE